MFIDSKDKKILIFTDVHMEIDRLERIISNEGADINICLGDMFDTRDSLLDNVHTFEKVIGFLNTFYSKSSNYHLIGNHDLQYITVNNQSVSCSGFNKKGFLTVKNSGLYDTIPRNLLFHIVVDDYLCTHAGLTDYWVNYEATLQNIDEKLTLFTPDALEKLQRSSFAGHWFWAAGESRGGFYPKGGITWCDARWEFVEIRGIKQMFGHTRSKTGGVYNPGLWVDPHNLDTNKSLCLDCGLNEWITITNGQMKIKKFQNL